MGLDGPHSEVVLEDIPVLAVDQQSGYSGTFTLGVTLAQAEILNAARQQGKVLPLLRPREFVEEPIPER
jgi:Flp pilus assembly protein CpaB